MGSISLGSLILIRVAVITRWLILSISHEMTWHPVKYRPGFRIFGIPNPVHGRNDGPCNPSCYHAVVLINKEDAHIYT
jgi:hypothetical protein